MSCLLPPYEIGQAIIFSCWGFFLFSFFFLSFFFPFSFFFLISPNHSDRRLDVYHTSRNTWCGTKGKEGRVFIYIGWSDVTYLWSQCDRHIVCQHVVVCVVKWWRFVTNWISWFKKLSVLSLSYWEIDVYWRQNNKHFAELAPQNGGKQLIWRNYVTVTLCVAHFHIKVHTKRLGMDHAVLLANNTMPVFPSWAFTRWHHHRNWGSRHPITAYYSFIDPERVKGWVGLVGWPIADGLPT